MASIRKHITKGHRTSGTIDSRRRKSKTLSFVGENKIIDTYCFNHQEKNDIRKDEEEIKIGTLYDVDNDRAEYYRSFIGVTLGVTGTTAGELPRDATVNRANITFTIKEPAKLSSTYEIGLAPPDVLVDSVNWLHYAHGATASENLYNWIGPELNFGLIREEGTPHEAYGELPNASDDFIDIRPLLEHSAYAGRSAFYPAIGTQIIWEVVTESFGQPLEVDGLYDGEFGQPQWNVDGIHMLYNLSSFGGNDVDDIINTYGRVPMAFKINNAPPPNVLLDEFLRLHGCDPENITDEDEMWVTIIDESFGGADPLFYRVKMSEFVVMHDYVFAPKDAWVPETPVDLSQQEVRQAWHFGGVGRLVNISFKSRFFFPPEAPPPPEDDILAIKSFGDNEVLEERDFVSFEITPDMSRGDEVTVDITPLAQKAYAVYDGEMKLLMREKYWTYPETEIAWTNNSLPLQPTQMTHPDYTTNPNTDGLSPFVFGTGYDSNASAFWDNISSASGVDVAFPGFGFMQIFSKNINADGGESNPIGNPWIRFTTAKNQYTGEFQTTSLAELYDAFNAQGQGGNFGNTTINVNQDKLRFKVYNINDGQGGNPNTWAFEYDIPLTSIVQYSETEFDIYDTGFPALENLDLHALWGDDVCGTVDNQCSSEDFIRFAMSIVPPTNTKRLEGVQSRVKAEQSTLPKTIKLNINDITVDSSSDGMFAEQAGIDRRIKIRQGHPSDSRARLGLPKKDSGNNEWPYSFLDAFDDGQGGFNYSINQDVINDLPWPTGIVGSTFTIDDDDCSASPADNNNNRTLKSVTELILNPSAQTYEFALACPSIAQASGFQVPQLTVVDIKDGADIADGQDDYYYIYFNEPHIIFNHGTALSSPGYIDFPETGFLGHISNHECSFTANINDGDLIIGGADEQHITDVPELYSTDFSNNALNSGVNGLYNPNTLRVTSENGYPLELLGEDEGQTLQIVNNVTIPNQFNASGEQLIGSKIIIQTEGYADIPKWFFDEEFDEIQGRKIRLINTDFAIINDEGIEENYNYDETYTISTTDSNAYSFTIYVNETDTCVLLNALGTRTSTPYGFESPAITVGGEDAWRIQYPAYGLGNHNNLIGQRIISVPLTVQQLAFGFNWPASAGYDNYEEGGIGDVGFIKLSNMTKPANNGIFEIERTDPSGYASGQILFFVTKEDGKRLEAEFMNDYIDGSMKTYTFCPRIDVEFTFSEEFRGNNS